VPQIRYGPCKARSSKLGPPGSGHADIDARVCLAEPTCCTTSWTQTCVNIAARLADVDCTAGKGCNHKLCGVAPYKKGPYNAIAVGRGFACARLSSDGSLRCWGGSKGFTAPAKPEGSGSEVLVTTPDFEVCGVKDGQQIHTPHKKCTNLYEYGGTTYFAGGDHLCYIGGIFQGVAALKDRPFCFDSNTYGQSAMVNIGDSSYPRMCVTESTGQWMLSEFKASKTVAAGVRHTCVLQNYTSTYDKVRCAGDNRWGQLGNGTTNVGHPKQAVHTLANVYKPKALQAGDEHTCYVDGYGYVYCWGRNDAGQAGVAPRPALTSRVKVPGLTSAKALALGARHSCALRTDGTVWCWGANNRMQLGPHAGSSSYYAVKVLTDGAGYALTGVTAIDAAGDSTCALRSDGSVGCWGDNSHGQLGLGAADKALCTPDCAGRVCGDDGCGGTCGSCEHGNVCQAGQCNACVPDCGLGVQCGDDGCGGTCGTCPSGQVCLSPPGLCALQPPANSCAGRCGGLRKLTDRSTCSCDPKSCGKRGEPKCCSDAAAQCTTCKPACAGRKCGDDGCGGSCGTCTGTEQCELGRCVSKAGCKGRCGSYNRLDYDGVPPGALGKVCSCHERCLLEGDCCADFQVHCAGHCSPQCKARECGSDGCGGSCGSCATGYSCTGAGRCVKAGLCKGQCGERKVSNGSGGSCSCDLEKCPFKEGGVTIPCCSDACQTCAGKGGCEARCGESSFDPDTGLACSCKPGCSQPVPGSTYGDTVCCKDKNKHCGGCVRQCGGKQCGNDGCGGTCGNCPSGSFCGEGMCLPLICTGRECGSGMTGGSCGQCGPGQTCISSPAGNSMCVAKVGCQGRCGGEGVGKDGLACSCLSNCATKGNCCFDKGNWCKSCVPQCKGRACGANGCGGSCGTCPKGKRCSSATGTCATAAAATSCANRCGYAAKIVAGKQTPGCSCDAYCDTYGDCCPDMKTQCPVKLGCAGRCGELALTAGGAICSCRFDCETKGDCCADAKSQCGICKPRCDDRSCGNDGCGGTCGVCPPAQLCNSVGRCEEQCAPGACAGSCTVAKYGITTPWAGSKTVAGTTEGYRTSARFKEIRGIVRRGTDGVLFVGDGTVIRKIVGNTVSTLTGKQGSAGHKDGSKTIARLKAPATLVWHADLGVMFSDKDRLRGVQDNGSVYSIPLFNQPTPFTSISGLAVDAYKNVVIADRSQRRLVKWTSGGGFRLLAGSGSVGTGKQWSSQPVARDGVGGAASFLGPTSVTIGPNNFLWVADGDLIRRVRMTGEVVTMYGVRYRNNSFHTAAKQFDADERYAGAVDARTGKMAPTAVFGDLRGGLFVTEQHGILSRIDGHGVIRALMAPGVPGFWPLSDLDQPVAAMAVHGTSAWLAGGTRITKLAVPTPCNDNDTCTADACVLGKCEHRPIPGCTLAVNAQVKGCDYFNATTAFTHAGKTDGTADGSPTTARFTNLRRVTRAADGALYVSDGHRIRRVEKHGKVSTVAGQTTAGNIDGPVAVARFDDPHGLVWHDHLGLLVADRDNHRIRAVREHGEVKTVLGSSAGSTDGSEAVAKFNKPYGVARQDNNRLYVADYGNNRVRRIDRDPVTGLMTVSTWAGSSYGYKNGKGTAAQFRRPSDIALDSQGNVFVADAANRRVRRIDPDRNVIDIAGTGGYGSTDGGPGVGTFKYPFGIAIHPLGGLLVVDAWNASIRQVTGISRNIRTIAGKSGTPGFADGGVNSSGQSLARFADPRGIVVVDASTAYVTDGNNDRLRRLQLPSQCQDDDPCTATACSFKKECDTYTLAGCAAAGSCSAPTWAFSRYAGHPSGYAGHHDAAPLSSRFKSPAAVTADRHGNVFVADGLNYLIRRIPRQGNVATIAGKKGVKGNLDGIGTDAAFGDLWAIANTREYLLLADTTNRRIRRLHKGTREISTWLYKHPTTGAHAFGTLLLGMAVSPDERTAYASDYHGHRVRVHAYGANPWPYAVVLGGASGSVDGVATEGGAHFKNPAGLAVDTSGRLYVADLGNHSIRRVEVGMDGKYTISTLAGGVQGWADGTGAAAKFNTPRYLTVDAADTLLVSDFGNHVIRTVSQKGEVATVIGKAGVKGAVFGAGSGARLEFPRGIATDPFGNVFVALRQEHQVGVFKSDVQCNDGKRCTLDWCQSGKCKHLKLISAGCL